MLPILLQGNTTVTLITNCCISIVMEVKLICSTVHMNYTLTSTPATVQVMNTSTLLVVQVSFRIYFMRKFSIFIQWRDHIDTIILALIKFLYIISNNTVDIVYSNNARGTYWGQVIFITISTYTST